MKKYKRKSYTDIADESVGGTIACHLGLERDIRLFIAQCIEEVQAEKVNKFSKSIPNAELNALNSVLYFLNTRHNKIENTYSELIGKIYEQNPECYVEIIPHWRSENILNVNVYGYNGEYMPLAVILDEFNRIVIDARFELHNVRNDELTKQYYVDEWEKVIYNRNYINSETKSKYSTFVENEAVDKEIDALKKLINDTATKETNQSDKEDE